MLTRNAMRLFWMTAIASLNGAVQAKDWAFEYQSATVSYATYGFGLGDPQAPTANDSKIAFAIQGSAAKKMFLAMGPDRKDECLGDSPIRFRSKDEEKLVCMKEKGSYRCCFGFDLRSGKSIGGSLC